MQHACMRGISYSTSWVSSTMTSSDPCLPTSGTQAACDKEKKTLVVVVLHPLRWIPNVWCRTEAGAAHNVESAGRFLCCIPPLLPACWKLHEHVKLLHLWFGRQVAQVLGFSVVRWLDGPWSISSLYKHINTVSTNDLSKMSQLRVKKINQSEFSPVFQRNS